MNKALSLAFKLIFSLLFIGGGINHLRNPDFYLRMMPPYLPFHSELVLVSGIFEILLGVLFLIPVTSKGATIGIILLLLAVFPANVHMSTHPRDFAEFSALGLWLRLPLQGLLIWWAVHYLKNGRDTLSPNLK